jgi:predicted RNA-binding protein with PUA domain
MSSICPKCNKDLALSIKIYGAKDTWEMHQQAHIKQEHRDLLKNLRDILADIPVTRANLSVRKKLDALIDRLA